jgi:hypothetical protein
VGGTVSGGSVRPGPAIVVPTTPPVGLVGAGVPPGRVGAGDPSTSVGAGDPSTSVGAGDPSRKVGAGLPSGRVAFGALRAVDGFDESRSDVEDVLEPDSAPVPGDEEWSEPLLATTTPPMTSAATIAIAPATSARRRPADDAEAAVSGSTPGDSFMPGSMSYEGG